MPLSRRSPTSHHVLQNVVLIFISIAFIPLLIFLAISSRIVSPILPITRKIKHTRKWRAKSSATFQPKTILVTGVGMSKGLTIARSFYRSGHRVIGADFEPYYIPVCGRFSTAISKFYRLRKPCGSSCTDGYIQDLIRVAKTESVDLWVSCSGVASAVEDGTAKEALEKIGVPAVQFGAEVTSLLHEKDRFIRNTKRIGLNVPETHLVVSTNEVLSILYPCDMNSPSSATFPNPEKNYIFKSVGLDDSIRADMTRLPLETQTTTREFISRFEPGPNRPFVLQELIKGQEYCTHSIAINGKIKAFTACESSELLMHYQPLSSTTNLFQAMLKYTKLYASRMGPDFTGHFSLDFLLQEDSYYSCASSYSQSYHHSQSSSLSRSEAGSYRDKMYPIEWSPDFTGHYSTDFLHRDDRRWRRSSDGSEGSDNDVEGLMNRLFPIECNPRAHTATVLLADKSDELADAYLSLLPGYESARPKSDEVETVVPSPPTPAYYWIGHDFITRVLLPVYDLLLLRIGIFEVLRNWMEFVRHLVFWKDGTFEIWDPWPALFLYAVYWPGMFVVSLWQRNWWSRCNVSTTKLFRC